MNASAQQTACPRCNGALAPGAQFCGACGSPVGPAAAQQPPQPPGQGYAPPQQQPYAPPMPQPQMMSRFSGAAGAGNSKQVNVQGGPMEAYQSALNALQGAGAEVHWASPPQSAKFILPRKSMLSTMGVTIKYDGDLAVSPAGPGQSVARLSLKLRWGSAAPLLLAQVGFVVFGAMFNIYIAYYSLILIGLFVGITAWTVASQVPEQALKALAAQIGTGAGAPMAQPAPAYAHAQAAPPAYAPAQPMPAQPMPAQPAPAPAVVAPAPQAPVAGGANADAVMEQLKQLGALQAAGVLTAAEFEAKKAELLSRL